MSKFKIEKGIPQPRSRAKRSKYPFAEMGVGDSFAVLDESAQVLRSAAFNAQRKFPGRKFSVRQCAGEVRAWRVA